jgi:hypothetical protein
VKLKHSDGWRIGRIAAVVSSFEVLQNRFRSSSISQNETIRAGGAGLASRWLPDILGVGEAAYWDGWYSTYILQ